MRRCLENDTMHHFDTCIECSVASYDLHRHSLFSYFYEINRWHIHKKDLVFTFAHLFADCIIAVIADFLCWCSLSKLGLIPWEVNVHISDCRLQLNSVAQCYQGTATIAEFHFCNYFCNFRRTSSPYCEHHSLVSRNPTWCTVKTKK